MIRFFTAATPLLLSLLGVFWLIAGEREIAHIYIVATLAIFALRNDHQ